MATLALGTIGTLAAGSIGTGTTAAIIAGAAAATTLTVAGGLIDAAFVYPAIMGGAGDQEGPRLEEVVVQSHSEGAPIHRFFGQRNRVGGTFIFIGDMVEKKVTESYGGSWLTPSTDVTNYEYSVDIAIALGLGEISGLRRIWADGSLIWRLIGTPSVSSANISVERRSGQLGFLPVVIMRIRSSSSGPNLTESFWNGSFVYTSGFSESGNNFATGLGLLCIKVGTEGSFTYIDLLNNDCVTESAGASVTVQHFQFGLTNPKHATSITVYKGTSDQSPDPFMELGTWSPFSPLGAPAYRGIAYVYFRSLQLNEFGRRIPMLSFEVDGGTTDSTGDVISALLQAAGVSTDDFDVTGCTDVVRGMVVAGPKSTSASLRVVMRAYDLVVRDDDGVLVFFKRTSVTTVSVDAGDLSAHESGLPTNEVYSITDVPTWTLPQEVNVTYLDTNERLSQATAKERLNNSTNNNNLNIQMPLSLSPDEGQQLAARILWEAWNNRQVITVTLPPTYFQLKEHDLLVFTVDDITFRMLITNIDKGNNYLCVIKGLIESPEAYLDSDMEGSQSAQWQDKSDPDDDEIGLPTDIVATPAYLALAWLDIPPIHNNNIGKVGVYIGIGRYDPNGAWDGGSLYQSTTSDNDDQFGLVGQTIIETTLGEATSVLPSGPVGYWDNENTVTVELYQGELHSHTEGDIFRGINWCILGDEILAFQTATLTDTFTYELSGLLRGLRATLTTGHESNDRFILLDTVTFLEYSLSRIDTTIFHKTLSVGANLEDMPTLTNTLVGNSVKPFPVSHLLGVRSQTNNLTFTWEHRTHRDFRMFRQAYPATDAEQNYDLELYDGAILLRTEEIDLTRTFTYTSGQQSGDGLSPGDPVTAKVYIKGVEIARGPVREVTI